MVGSKSVRTPFYFPAVFVFTVVFLFAVLSARVCTSYELLIGTDKADSFSNIAGKSICRSIKNFDKDVTCRLVPSEDYSGSLTNLQSGSLDMALVSSKVIYDAFHKAGFFEYIDIQYDGLRLLMPLYRSPISLIVRRDAGVSSLDDLDGKRINAGAAYSIENQIFGELMSLKDWRKSNFLLYQNLSPMNSQDSLALKSGSVQAMIHVGMHPDDTLLRLLTQSSTDLIGVDDEDVSRLIDSKVGFSSGSIDAGTYPGLSADLNTLAMETLLLTSAEADDETVQLVLDAITGAQQQLQNVHPSLLREKVDTEMLSGSYLSPHPAAMRFFQND